MSTSNKNLIMCDFKHTVVSQPMTAKEFIQKAILTIVFLLAVTLSIGIYIFY